MDRVITRRALLAGLAKTSGGLYLAATLPLIREPEALRRFWALDRTMLPRAKPQPQFFGMVSGYDLMRRYTTILLSSDGHGVQVADEYLYRAGYDGLRVGDFVGIDPATGRIVPMSS